MKIKAIIFSLFILFASNIKAQTASEIMDNAYNQAKIENKNVFLIFHASWCGWCKKMEKNMEDDLVKEYFDSNYVKAFITVEERGEKAKLNTPGGNNLVEKLGGKNQGLPYWVILDEKGNVLKDSRINGENVGGPASEKEVDFLISVLEPTSKNQKIDPDKIKEVFILKKKS
ncbi:thioredoxin family protein [Faecalibacter bovis]|uniref:Thioredoxin family protein n=1 Tax=Faecalibacter bovis TaxID=2898187 RepID=A0ABX7XG39_9FLAO|nr:thioredoxin family protein [Faecalibacter bovis]MBS7333096.1 thioredoxin family protein [Weeksellaceae bacterium]QTV06854.1 thioredoxin family protein [Faecalibacter bovis]